MTTLHATTTLEGAEIKAEEGSEKKTEVSHSIKTNGKPEPEQHDLRLGVHISAAHVPITSTSTGCLALSLHDLDPHLPRHVPIDMPLRDIHALAEQAAKEQAFADSYHPAATASSAPAGDSKDQGDGTKKQKGLEQDQIAGRPNATAMRHSVLAQIKARCVEEYAGKKRFYSTQSWSRTVHNPSTVTSSSLSSMVAPAPPGQDSRRALSRPTASAGLVATRRPLGLALLHARDAARAPNPALAYRGTIFMWRSVKWAGGLFSRPLR